jgi:hypothetical protein
MYMIVPLIKASNDIIFGFCLLSAINLLLSVSTTPGVSGVYLVPSQGHYGFHSFPVVD